MPYGDVCLEAGGERGADENESGAAWMCEQYDSSGNRHEEEGARCAS